MDDEVAELAALRRRAYGPDADIDGDPAALARLDELETRARRAAAPAGDEEPLPAAAGRDAEPALAASAAVVVGAADQASPRLGRRTVVVAGIVALAAVIAAQVMTGPASAPQFVASPPPTVQAQPEVVRALDASETTLVDIPLDRSLARYVPQPAAPRFPVEGALTWAESLGSYYGWTLWLARSTSTEERCVLLDRGDRTYERCASDERFLSGLLDVAVPYGDVAPEYRPARMTSGQSLVFRWTPERGVSILLDEADITYFGDND